MAIFLKDPDGFMDSSATTGGSKHRPVVRVPIKQNTQIHSQNKINILGQGKLTLCKPSYCQSELIETISLQVRLTCAQHIINPLRAATENVTATFAF